MTQRDKLDERLHAGRSLTFVEFQKLLEAYGFEHVRTRGSHLIYTRTDVDQQLSIQPKGKEAKAYQVRQFAAILARYELKPGDSE